MPQELLSVLEAVLVRGGSHVDSVIQSKVAETILDVSMSFFFLNYYF